MTDRAPASSLLPDVAAHELEPEVRLIDWDLAVRGARLLTPPGPKISPAQAQEAVGELREASQRAYEPVATTSGLHTPTGPEPALIVDRPTWVEINVASFRAMVDPVIAKALVRPGKPTPGPVTQRLGGLATGGEVGALLAFMSTKVLGQYDLAYGGGRPRLLLVAPNVVSAERELDLDPHDFRLWVCLHEETHRVQFTAVPWLREYMITQTQEMAARLVPDADHLMARLTQAVKNAPDVLRKGGTGLPELFLDEEQRADVARLTAIMALLEGHADVVMDEVGPQVVPSVEKIRACFDERRKGQGHLDVLLRRMLGLEAKMAQYRDGAAFVRYVIDHSSLADFNAVWTSPETLPRPVEIEDPQRWIDRVHG